MNFSLGMKDTAQASFTEDRPGRWHARACRILGCYLPLWLACTALTVNAETFRVGVEMTSYAPHFEIRQGQYRGYAREVLDAYGADAGHQFEYVLLPVKRLLPSLLIGNIDFRYPDNPRWFPAMKVNSQIRYSLPLAISIAGASVLPERVGHGHLQTLGVMLGFKAIEFSTQINSGMIKQISASKMNVLIKMAMHSRVEGVYGDANVIRHHLKQQGFAVEALVFDHTRPHSRHPFSLSTIHYPQELDDFDLWLQEHQALVEQLQEKFGLVNFEQSSECDHLSAS